ncbi:MAG TPA: DUF5818 domain-containing protein [Bauldia sp.]|nr:DUF5818 domain-containing protein [Bauldia sp.]
MIRGSLVALAGAAIVAVVAIETAPAQTLLDKAREAVQDAGRQIEDAAREAGRDASDFLADNPDLNRDLIDLGKRMGLPGFEDAQAYVGANLTVTPPTAGPGSGVMVTAVGLPGNARVKLGFGPPQEAYQVIATPVASDRGVVEVAVPVPSWARPGEMMVFTAETEDQRVRLVSEPFAVVEPGPAPGTAIDVTGTLSNEGVECPSLRGDDGKLYTIADPTAGGFKPGDRVRVTGEVAGMSMCMQGITIAHPTISAAEG